MIGPDDRWASAAALPLAWIYRAVVAARNGLYDRGVGVRRAPIPVVSVGNLTVGGTGKTPLVVEVVTRLVAAGRRPGVVSRGYGGRAGRGPVRLHDAAGRALGPGIAGDEPWMLASRLQGVPVVVGSDRHLGVLAAASDGADVAVLDDGFQHRRLARDLDIVVLHAERPLANGRLLPAGPLREPPSSLRRADLLVLIGSEERELSTPDGADSLRANPRFGIVRARRRPRGFLAADGRPAAAPRRAIAFCGIGDPRSFRTSLQESGVAVADLLAFPDHHPFSESDLRELLERSDREGLPLVTTEKDLSRLHGRLAASPIAERVVALSVDLAFADATPLERALGVATAAGDRR